MNCNLKQHRLAPVLAAVFTGVLALSAGCSSLTGDGDAPVELAPTTYVAVAPLDLSDDYFSSSTVYVPVAPLDLPDDYFTRASAFNKSGTDETVAVASADDDWMMP